MVRSILPTGNERHFPEDELIVSKTDIHGRITYANRLFVDMSGYSRSELFGAPHSIIRHPDMPRGVFKLLWDRLLSGHEVFAYVKNLAKNGDHYWVLAHVTPTFDERHEIISFHSNRRCPTREALPIVEEIYARMLGEEAKHPRASAADASLALLRAELEAKKTTYDELVFAIGGPA